MPKSKRSHDKGTSGFQIPICILMGMKKIKTSQTSRQEYFEF
jgi:hypothetical protein